MRGSNARGITAISLLVAVFIAAVLAAYLLSVYTGSSKDPNKRANAPIKQAQSVDCMNNLSQIRGAIELYNASNGSYPPDLSSISQSIQGSVLKCPVSGNAYQYDPVGGKVWCVTPGHEKY